MAKTGFDCKLYRNSGTYDTPVWVLLKELGDLRIPTFEWGAAEVKVRSSKWKAFLKTMIEVGFEFDYLYKADPTNWNFLRDAALDPDTQVEFLVADGLVATEGTEGLRLITQVFGMPFNQELENVSMTAFSAKPTYATDEDGIRIEPSWLLVAGA